MSDTDLDKGKLLAALLVQLEAKLNDLRAGYGAARDAVLSTPHVMKSKREVFGQESAYLANALSLNIQEREHELKLLRGLRLPKDPERVALGCLVGVGSGDVSLRAFYLLLPVCGGMEIPLPSGGVARVITPATPIAKALLGKEFEDEVRVPNAPDPQFIRLLQ
jgi:hypothetical protein